MPVISAAVMRHRWDRLRGLDFQTVSEPGAVGLDPQSVFRSSPSPADELRAAVDEFGLSRFSSVLDVGCGRGSALRTLLGCGFSVVHGIELSEELADRARLNFRRLRRPDVEVMCADATRFDGYGRYELLYLYNPFPRDVAEVCFRQIERCGRDGRPVSVLYLNSTMADVVTRTGRFELVGSRTAASGHRTELFSAV